MKLQGRNLSVGLRGEDVQLLQSELRQLGYEISQQEFQDGLFRAETEKAVREFQRKHEIEATGIVDNRTATLINAEVDKLNPFIVKGQIRKADGSVAVGVTVVAFDKDLRSEEALGKVKTDNEGRYQIPYIAEQFQRLEKKTADLIVRVFGEDETQLMASPIIFNAAPIEIVDLVIGGGEYRGLSEYERLMAELTPLVGEISLADLKENEEFQDVTFLTGETEIKPQLIAFLILAARHSRTTNVPPEAFYGLFRQNLPTNLPALLLVSPQIQRRALETAIQKNTIPARFSAQIERILETLQALIGRQVLDPANNTQPFLFGQLLDTLGISRDKQETFLKSYINHQGRIQDFWQSLRQNPAFERNNQVESLQFTLQLGMLTQNHIPLVKELQAMRTNGFLNSPKDLVKLDEAAWTTLIRKQVNGKAIGLPPDVLGENEVEKTRNYVNAMMGLVEKAFPTPAIAHRVSQDNRPEKAHLRQFLTNNSDFEFASTHIDTYLTNARGMPENPPERDALTRQLKTMQRVFQVTPDYAHMQVLMAKGLDSAYSISRVPETILVEALGSELDGIEKVKAIKSNADMRNAINTTAYAAIHQEFNDVRLAVIDNGKQGDTLKQNPNLTALFGSLDLCDCKDCRSVYSPAAYFVDLLHFLSPDPKYWNSIKFGSRPIDALLQRRPDLEHILLTCENTNTPLPYIDLVNEILEYYVTSNKLDDKTAKNTIDITAEELSVNPQYTIDAAYTKLKDAVYPLLSLPFNRPIEVARTYLEHLGSSRYQVMDTFKGSSGPSEEAIACEYLKISPKECQILLGAPLQPSKQLWEFYGYSSATVSNQDWKVHLAQVPEFLKQTRISYLDLIELLKTRFLNPNQGPNTQSTLDTPVDKDPCDLNNVTIKPLNEGMLKKMHRFIRLWRKLGWEIRDLDKVIQALGANDINDTFLRKLAQVKQLQTDLKLPLVQLLGFWANIDTYGADALYPKLFQNKAVLNPVDSDFKLDENSLELQLVVDAGNDSNKKPKISPPEVPNQKVPNRIPAILAALRINAADLEAMRMDTGLDDRPNTNPPTFADLNLANLSKLYRLALLARTLKLPVKDLIALKTLTGIDPFSTPSETLKFVEKVRKVRQSHFSVAQLNYLYRHISEPVGSIAPQQENLSLLIKNLRDGLNKIADDNHLEPDLNGELTRKKLGTTWDSALVDQFIPMLDGSATYTTKLDSLPSLTFPDAVTNNIFHYDATTNQLRFLGEMTENEKTLLLCFAREGNYQSAVNSLFQKSHVTPLTSLPPIEFPDSLTNTIFYDVATKQLQFVGQMTEDEKELLFSLSTEEDYQNAVNSLQTQATTSLDSLPLIEPQSVNRKISYGATTQLLQFLGGMTDEEKNQLHSLSKALNYQNALDNLFKKSNSSNSLTYEASLNSWSNKLTFPVSGNKISYNPTTQILQFVGAMTVSERTILVNLSNDKAYQEAIDHLFQRPRLFISNTVSNTNASFLNSADAIAQLLNSGMLSAEEKFAYVLTRLLPYLQGLLSRSLIKQTLSDALKLDSAVTELLLESVLKAYTDASKTAIADFLALLGDGLKAEYFNNPALTDPPIVTRIEPTVNFNWGKESPDEAIAQGAFSVRWTGKLLAEYEETYTFYLRKQGSMDLQVNNQSITDGGTVSLKAGQLYDITVTYAKSDANGNAIAQLSWSSPSTPKAIIPQKQLYAGTTFTSFDLPLKSYYLLHKVSLLVNNFKITVKELAYLSDHPDDFKGVDSANPADSTKIAPFNLNVLPLNPSNFRTALFDQWLRLSDLFALRDSLPNGEIGLIDVFEFAAVGADKSKLSRSIIKQLATDTSQNPSFMNLLVTWTNTPKDTIKQILLVDWTRLSEAIIKQQIVDPNNPLNNFVNLLAKLDNLQILNLMLASATSWDAKELTDLIGSQGLTLSIPAHFKNEVKLLTLQACLSLSKRLGVSIKQLFNWAITEPDSSQAQDIIKTVKAKYEDEQWLIIAKPLSDRLRESQKSALIDYVLAKSEIHALGISNSNQLFEYFLIDVDMCACMATSRIKQAISSVQLFVQRCLMNLENKLNSQGNKLPLTVQPDAINDHDWKWMKNYRIWEANRKVFLYPENWIEPDLRDNKSPFFKEMESQLLQNDVTMDTAEQAFLNYLEKLDDVARLDICGMYWQEKEDKEDKTEILHVFGRTFNTPHIYYYRHLIVDTNVWTPWEKVNLDIEGDHLIPIVYNRRLYLFWPLFIEKADEQQNSSQPPSNSGKQEQTNEEKFQQKIQNLADQTGTNEVFIKIWFKTVDDLASQKTEPRSEFRDFMNQLIENSKTFPISFPGSILLSSWMELYDLRHSKINNDNINSSNQGSNSNLIQQPQKHWEIKLAWSEYKQNKWTSKQVSIEMLMSKAFSYTT